MARVTGTKRSDFIALSGVSAGVAGRPTEEADHIEGRDGNDQVFAAGGDDQVFGGTGNDLLLGEAGADTLHGERGDDTLVGGAGADRFVLSAGRDVIADFSFLSMEREVITFTADVPPGGIRMPDGFAGLDWTGNLELFDDASAGVDDRVKAFTGGDHAVIAEEAFGFSSGTDFSLASLRLIPNPDDEPLSFSVTGYRDGKEVFTQTLDIPTQGRTFTFDPGLLLDEVRFGGTGSGVILDDLELIFARAGDRLQVGSVSERNALLASARDDGAGNTVMGRGSNTVTLLDIRPEQVSADWFLT